jgi:hypothetical protein
MFKKIFALVLVLSVLMAWPAWSDKPRRYGCTALTGGGSGALDALKIAGGDPDANVYPLISGTSAVVVMLTGSTATVYEYVFDALGTDPENAPDVIRPDDYTTAGVWRRARGADPDPDIAAIAALTTLPWGRDLLTLNDAAAARQALGLVIGVNVLAPDGDGSLLTGIAEADTVWLAAKPSYDAHLADTSKHIQPGDPVMGTVGIEGAPNTLGVEFWPPPAGGRAGFRPHTTGLWYGYNLDTGKWEVNGGNVAAIEARVDNLEARVYALEAGQASTYAALQITPTTWDFGETETGSTSASKTFVVTSVGTKEATLAATTLSGTGAGMFTVGANTCTAASTLPVDATCTVAVTHGPTATGVHTASLNVASDAADSPKVAALSGTGVAPPAIYDDILFHWAANDPNSDKGDLNGTNNGITFETTPAMVGTCAGRLTANDWINFSPVEGAHFSKEYGQIGFWYAYDEIDRPLDDEDQFKLSFSTTDYILIEWALGGAIQLKWKGNDISTSPVAITTGTVVPANTPVFIVLRYQVSSAGDDIILSVYSAAGAELDSVTLADLPPFSTASDSQVWNLRFGENSSDTWKIWTDNWIFSNSLSRAMVAIRSVEDFN